MFNERSHRSGPRLSVMCGAPLLGEPPEAVSRGSPTDFVKRSRPLGMAKSRAVPPALRPCNLELLEKTYFYFASRDCREYASTNPVSEPSSSHDRLFLQRPERPRRAPRRERGPAAAAHTGTGLWMSG